LEFFFSFLSEQLVLVRRLRKVFELFFYELLLLNGCQLKLLGEAGKEVLDLVKLVARELRGLLLRRWGFFDGLMGSILLCHLGRDIPRGVALGSLARFGMHEDLGQSLPLRIELYLRGLVLWSRWQLVFIFIEFVLAFFCLILDPHLLASSIFFLLLLELFLLEVRLMNFCSLGLDGFPLLLFSRFPVDEVLLNL
jgi:hypothetical protein